MRAQSAGLSGSPNSVRQKAPASRCVSRPMSMSGTSATAAPMSSGCSVSISPARRPPALPPWTVIRSGVVTPRSTSCRAIAARPSTTTPRRAALLWPGWDTQGVAAGSNSRTDLDVRYAGPDGVRISMFLMAGLGGVQSRLADGGYELKPSGSPILQDYPAHTHVNWFFSKAGRYTLTVTARSSKADGTSATTVPHTYTIDVGHVDRAGAQAASGSSAPASSATRATTTLTLNVGPGATGNATEGHFDLGPAIIDGALVARVKDDRHQPAAWVDPASLTFALGDAAALKAPKDVSFVAKEGSTVRMIRSTQVRGVPWLGMNSQREEIVNGTTGEVTFRLDSVDGPDKVVVFAAGGLGTGVGQHVFDGAGSSYTLPANTHAHQNWLVTQPGTYHLTITMSVTPKDGALAAGTGDGKAGSDSVPEAGTVAARAPGGLRATGEKGPNGLSMVEETVGRTPDGRPCDLGDLARTGTDPVAPLAASALLGLLGAGVLTGRRRALSHRGQ